MSFDSTALISPVWSMIQTRALPVPTSTPRKWFEVIAVAVDIGDSVYKQGVLVILSYYRDIMCKIAQFPKLCLRGSFECVIYM